MGFRSRDSYGADQRASFPTGGLQRPIKKCRWIRGRAREWTLKAPARFPSPLLSRVEDWRRLPRRLSLSVAPCFLWEPGRRSPTWCGLFHEVSARPVTQTRRSIAIESNLRLFEWVLPPLV